MQLDGQEAVDLWGLLQQLPAIIAVTDQNGSYAEGYVYGADVEND